MGVCQGRLEVKPLMWGSTRRQYVTSISPTITVDAFDVLLTTSLRKIDVDFIAFMRYRNT